MDGSCKDNIDLVNEGGFACLTNDLSAKNIYSNDITDTGKCNYYTTHPLITWSFSMIFPVCYFSTYLQTHTFILVLFQKGSPHIKEFNKHISLMTEMGLMKKWMENSLSKADRCNSIAKILESHERKGIVLNIHITSTFFLMALSGLMTTILVFGAEIFKKSMITNKKSIVTL